MIFGVSDRMVTGADIQFEPPAPKVLTLTSSIVSWQAMKTPPFMEKYYRTYQLMFQLKFRITPNNG